MQCGKCLETIDNVLKEEQSKESFANKSVDFNNLSPINI
jgi:bacterioferritin-associated ferredoxin|tara:strand:+ start:1482 stop:1598 length:117 start_codon:yes stop_codon:yes gene_type:complete